MRIDAKHGSSVVRYACARKCGNAVLTTEQRLRTRLEHGELVDDALAFRRVAPDADALMRRGFPSLLIDHDGVPADLPFESRWRHRVKRQLLVVGVLTDAQCHVESELLDSLIGRQHVVEL